MGKHPAGERGSCTSSNSGGDSPAQHAGQPGELGTASATCQERGPVCQGVEARPPAVHRGPPVRCSWSFNKTRGSTAGKGVGAAHSGSTWPHVPCEECGVRPLSNGSATEQGTSLT